MRFQTEALPLEEPRWKRRRFGCIVFATPDAKTEIVAYIIRDTS